jgi:hypothetical protein
LSVALVIVAVVALAAFGLVLVLARRLRGVTERVNMFLPLPTGTLPLRGTPVPEFDAVSVAGERVTRGAFAGVERIFAVLSTGCGSCYEQIEAFLEYGPDLVPRPIVLVVGPPQDRATMVARLGGDTVVIEEPDRGLVAEAFEISEFPAVLLIRDGYIQQAEHGLAAVMGSLVPADSPRQD